MPRRLGGRCLPIPISDAPGRNVAAGIAALGGLLAWRYLLSRHARAPAPAIDTDLARAEALLRSAEEARPDAELAFTGDKSFIFQGDAFVMTARGGGSLIAMGGPIGKRAHWRDTLAALRREADALSLRPVVYAAPPELLPDLIDAGFRVEKVGENAMIDTQSFSMDGPARRNLRTARRRFVEREGAVFEVRLPPHDASLWMNSSPFPLRGSRGRPARKKRSHSAASTALISRGTRSPWCGLKVRPSRSRISGPRPRTRTPRSI